MGQLVCWQCGESLKEIPKPFTRLEQCRKCHADLHVCVMCRYYNPCINDKCDHDMAERAREFDIANFCHYYKPKPDAFVKGTKKSADEAANKLNALFGEEITEESSDVTQSTSDSGDDIKKRFDDLFK